MVAPSSDGDARPEYDIRLDGDVFFAELGVGGQKHGFRRDQGDARLHGGGAQALLQDGFGLGELRLGIDAAHVVLRGFDRDCLQAHIAGDGNRIAEIILAFGIGVADALEHTSACWPDNAIRPPLQKPTLRSSVVASLCSRMASRSSPRSAAGHSRSDPRR